MLLRLRGCYTAMGYSLKGQLFWTTFQTFCWRANSASSVLLLLSIANMSPASNRTQRIMSRGRSEQSWLGERTLELLDTSVWARPLPVVLSRLTLNPKAQACSKTRHLTAKAPFTISLNKTKLLVSFAAGSFWSKDLLNRLKNFDHPNWAANS